MTRQVSFMVDKMTDLENTTIPIETDHHLIKKEDHHPIKETDHHPIRKADQHQGEDHHPEVEKIIESLRQN